MSRVPPLPGRFAVLTAMLLAACVGTSPDEREGEPSLAKGGGSGGAAADPAVTATDPTSAPQDTTITLRVLGTGYDRGSKVELLLNGQSLTTIKTNSTKYVNSTELAANITIAADALVDSYDVAVTTSTGRRGVGTELFAVRVRGNTDLDSHANWTFYSTLSDGVTATGIYGDGRGLDGGPSSVAGESTYPGETCGVRGKLFNSVTASNSGDAVFSPAFTTDPTACGDRSMTVRFPDYANGAPISFNPFTNAQNVWYQDELQTIGGSFVEDMGFSNGGASFPCGSNNGVRLGYRTSYGSGVRVTRLPDQGAARVWEVESTGNHLAGCWATVKGKDGLRSTHYLPFHARIVEVPAPAGGW